MAYRLCYVDEPWAWFTNIEPFTDQWGDDWNDAPYSANAGKPYKWHSGMKRGPYDVFQVAYEPGVDLDAPSSWGLNEPWSVQDINSGKVAWLATPSYVVNANVVFPAGIEYSEFVKKMMDSGGVVYVPLDPVFDPAQTMEITGLFPDPQKAAA